MRIVHVISSPSGIGGAERVLLELVRAGNDRGWQQRVLNPFSKGSELSDLCPPCIYASYPASRLREILGARSWLRRELTRFEPQIVHVHLFHGLVLVASLPRPSGVRLVLTHHHGSRYASEGDPMREWADRLCGRRYHAVVAVSEATRRMLTERYGYPATKLWTIPNGWFGRPVDRGGAPGHRIVCVANFRPQKGHDVLLLAFQRVLRSVPDASLVLVGDGSLRDAAVTQAGDLGLSPSVRFEGSVLNVWPLLAQADVFALASRYEPLGLAVLEAMAAGLPVVATAVDGLRDLIEPGVTGELVPSGDPDALASALVALLQAPERLLAMGAAGRERAAHHGAGRMVEGYVRMYEKLLSQLPASTSTAKKPPTRCH